MRGKEKRTKEARKYERRSVEKDEYGWIMEGFTTRPALSVLSLLPVLANVALKKQEEVERKHRGVCSSRR
jgi:hypothetical protein